ncbi:MAG: YafY family transcriptional regulator [Anaerolineae bacterium]|nr:YafY family transcriptional regulator [Anaerolineae bacterium]
MYHPTTRLLTVLELLQTHGQMSGAALGARLEVDARTVRKYIMMLQDIGIPVEAEMGRYGGYGLRAGFKLPPMMFTNDEAFALVLGLLAARQMGLAEGAAAVEGTLAKLYRVLPEALRETAQAMETALTLDLPAAQGGAVALLAAFSVAINQHRQVFISYRRGDESSERNVDPYGLVIHDGVWYLIGYCHLRQDVRVFRLDRIGEARTLDATFTPPPDFDALDYLIGSIATMPDRWRVEVILQTTLEQAAGRVPRGMGTLEAHENGVLFRTGSEDIDWMARYLVGLGFPLTVRQPPELRAAFARLAARIVNF